VYYKMNRDSHYGQNYMFIVIVGIVLAQTEN